VRIANCCVLTWILAAVVSASPIPIKTNGRSSYGFNPTPRVGCLSPGMPTPSLANCPTDPITEYSAAASVAGDEVFIFSVTSPTLTDFSLSVLFPFGVDTSLSQPVGDFIPEPTGTASDCTPNQMHGVTPCDTTHLSGLSASDSFSISGNTVTFDIRGGDGFGLDLYVVASNSSTVPEPSSAALLSLVFLGLVTLGRVHKHRNEDSPLTSVRKL
jgi:hypothetical protein